MFYLLIINMIQKYVNKIIYIYTYPIVLIAKWQNSMV